MRAEVVVRQLARVLLVLGFGVFISTGCGGAPQPKKAPASNETLELVLLVRPGRNTEELLLAESLKSELVRVGFQVAASEDAQHDAVLRVATEVRDETGIMTVYVNGRPKKNRVVRATVAILASGAALETGTTEYNADEPIPRANLDELVAVIAKSPGLRALAARERTRRTTAAAEERQRVEEAERLSAAQAKAEKEQAEAEERAAWNQVVLSSCIDPKALDCCNAVFAFLQKYPNGLFAAEAKQALEVGQKRIDALEDEIDWTGAEVDRCEKPARSSDCDGAKRYLELHPLGVHAEEAKAAVQGSRSTIDSLRAAEEKKLAAEVERDAAEEKKAARKACEKDCLGTVCFNVRPNVLGICMDRCIQAECE